MSKASQQLVDRSGANHPMYGKVPASAFQSGANNPMFGLTGANHRRFGKSHSDETRAQISDSQQLVDRSGANNPMYGKVAANAMTINVYSLDGTLINSFSSQVAAALWLNTSQTLVSRYIKSGTRCKDAARSDGLEQSIYLSKLIQFINPCLIPACICYCFIISNNRSPNFSAR